LTQKEEEERRIAEMGRPMLGEHTKLEVVIEESYEFKVSSTGDTCREREGPESRPRGTRLNEPADSLCYFL